MNVLFVGPLPEPVTGHSLACQVFLDALQRRHQVEVVNLSKRGLKHGVDSAGRVVEVAKIVGAVWRRKHRADAIYFTVSESLAGNLKDLLVYTVCFRQLKRMVIHLHGAGGMRRIMHGGPVLRALNEFFLRRVGGAIVLGSRHVDIFQGAVPAERVHVVPNFAEDYLFIDPAGIDAKFRETEPLRLVYLSNLLPGKGYWELLEAYLSLEPAIRDRATLDFAGSFQTEPDRERFEQKIAGHSGVRYHGPVRGAAKRDLLQRSHVFCLPTYYVYEGQPISLLEAYAAGCAVITTDHSGIPDVFTPDQNGYQVPTRSVPELANAIRRAIAEPERLRVMAHANLVAATTHFRTSNYNANLLNVVEPIGARAAGGAAAPAMTTTPVGTEGLAVRRRPSIRPYQLCVNCVMDTSDSGIQFDDRGWCDYCNNFHQSILPNWHPDEIGKAAIDRTVDEIRRAGAGKSHDCLIGISGGVDSSYLTLIAKETFGLRPLLYHVDGGWNSQESVNNIERMVDGLGLDLHTEVINWPEMQDLQLAFFKAQVPHIDTPQDHAFFGGLYNFAARHDFKYILTGANYSTECVKEPIEWHYHATDLRQLKDIHQRFGRRPLESFPLINIFTYKLFYRYVKGIRVVKLLDSVPFTKDAAMAELARRFGWQRYPHKHYESRFTRFYEGYWLPNKFGYDKRRAHYSSLILTGQMTREAALAALAHPAYDEQTVAQDFEYVATKLDLSVDELRAIMNGPNKSYRDYKNSESLIALGASVLRLLGAEKRVVR